MLLTYSYLFTDELKRKFIKLGKAYSLIKILKKTCNNSFNLKSYYRFHDQGTTNVMIIVRRPHLQGSL